MNSWDPEADRKRLECVHVGSAEIRQGDRVVLRPRGRADILDLALAGKTAAVEAIEQDFDGRIYLAVTVDDDPGKDLGVLRQPDDSAHAELEPAPGLVLLAELVRQAEQAGVHVDVDVTGEIRALPEGVDVSAYRIIQEGLTNVVRHVGPTNAHLRVNYLRDEVEIELVDEGTATRGGPAPTELDVK